MLVIPAIDIRAGRVVRLQQGDRRREQIYGDDPVRWAARFRDLGASWLHVVDLDGAFQGRPVHLDAVRRIAALGIPVQLGGGFRTLESIASGLAAGASRIIVGTAARALGEALAVFGEQVAVSLDARGGRVAVEGWERQTGTRIEELAGGLRDQGVRRFIYTDIDRDGMLAGPNLEALAAFVRTAAVPVIAAGGVSGPADLDAAAAAGVEGVIVGRALYEGRLDLRDALARWSAARC